MSAMTPPIDEHELHLYVDEHLSEERRGAVEALLRDRPEVAARVNDYRHQNELMRQLFNPAGSAPPTDDQERLLQALGQRLGRGRMAALWRPAMAAAAGLFLAATLGAVGTEYYDERTTVLPEPMPSFADTAARVHTFYAGGGGASEPTEFGADAAGKLGPLLDKRLGAPLRLPDLSQKGFSLVGGRLLPAVDGAAAQLLYRDQAGRLVSVFLGPADKTRLTATQATERKDLSLYTWLDGRIGVAVVGGLSGDELRSIAEVTQRSLLPPPGNGARPEDRPGAIPDKDAHPDASRT
jgi:anti-sigma factor RsiW